MAVKVYTTLIWLGDDEEPVTEYLVCDGKGSAIALLSGSLAGAVARLLGELEGRLVSEAEARAELEAGAEDITATFDGSELEEGTPVVLDGTLEGREVADAEVFVAVGPGYAAVTPAHHHAIDAQRDLGRLLGTWPEGD